MHQMNILRSGGSIARFIASIFMIAFLAVPLFPADVAAAQLKLHTDQQMIEELLEELSPIFGDGLMGQAAANLA